MLSTSQSEQTTDEGVVLDAKPACVALVPVVPSAQWSQSPGSQWSLPSSIFVTHLIATAEPVPQTRGLRQATLADAQTAYGASRSPIQSAGRRTRQII
jgi:hypothetical protein